MAQYISKDALVAEIEKKKKSLPLGSCASQISMECNCKNEAYNDILSFLNTLEVKEVETWHLQEKEDIYDAVKDWSLYIFACVMKDGTVQRFTGNLDEDYEGHINVYIDGVGDVDDIVKWIEFT